MSRAVTIGNGSILVGLDRYGQVRDFYYPYVGHSNHVSGASGSYTHRIGVFVDDKLSWISDDGWQAGNSRSVSDLVGCLKAHNKEIGIELSSFDAVHNEKTSFLGVSLSAMTATTNER